MSWIGGPRRAYGRGGGVESCRCGSEEGIEVLGYGVIVSLFFAPLKKDYDSIQSRFGFIQELVGKFDVQSVQECLLIVLGIYFVGMLQNIAVYPAEKKVRESFLRVAIY